MSAAEAQYRKALEKYRIASGNAPANALVIKRRWWSFLVLEAIFVAAFVTVFRFGDTSEVAQIACAILGASLVVTLPIAFLYLIGRPQIIDLCPLVDSAETRAMTRDVKQRMSLSEEEFYSQFFEGSEISNELIAKIRRRLRTNIDKLADRLVPTDYLPILWEHLDFADLFYVLNREFGTTIDFNGFDGTLESLIRSVHAQSQREPQILVGVRKPN